MAVGKTISITSPERIVFEYTLADLGTRLAAYVIDLCVKVFFLIFVLLALGISGSNAESTIGGLFQSSLVIVIFLVKWFGFALMETVMGGQTPGKRLLGIRVIKADGEPLDFSSILMRNFLRVVDEFPAFPLIGGVTASFNRTYCRLGDIVAGTIVVYESTVDLQSPDFKVHTYRSRQIEKKELTRRLSEQQLYIIRKFLNSLDTMDSAQEEQIAYSLAEKVKKALKADDSLEDPVAFLEKVYRSHGSK